MIIHQSSGGINGTLSEQYASYTGAMLNAAKSLYKIGESVLNYANSSSNNNNNNNNNLQTNSTNMNDNSQQILSTTTTTNNNNNNNNNNTNSTRHRHGSGKDETQAGIVTIVDTVKLFGVRFI